MMDSYSKLFNSNWVMHALFYFIGAMIAQIYNCFFIIEYTIIHTIIYILLLSGFMVLFFIQYNKYNKDV